MASKQISFIYANRENSPYFRRSCELLWKIGRRASFAANPPNVSLDAPFLPDAMRFQNRQAALEISAHKVLFGP